MKKLDLKAVTQSINPEAWNYFRTDPMLSGAKSSDDRAGLFIVAVTGQFPAKTMDNMRRLGKALDKIEANYQEVELSEEELKILKEAWDAISPNFPVAARGVVLPISDALGA